MKLPVFGKTGGETALLIADQLILYYEKVSIKNGRQCAY
ncbi:MAG: hypothetical protein JWP71_47 [Mucilaginibacter sp.]|nr:hypothetical protein [Mucilaginibacter sp.]